MRIPKVQNMLSRKGTYNQVANQFIISGDGFTAFQSYQTIIAVNKGGQITLDKDDWNYSVTTACYRNIFLGENTAETRKKIKSGVYKLANLNK